MTNYYIVFVTAPKGALSKKLADIVLKKKLCACVNIVKKVESYFWWEGKIDKACEALLIMKTKKTLLPKLINAIKVSHTYKVCEIIALPIMAGHKPYLDWIGKSCIKG